MPSMPKDDMIKEVVAEAAEMPYVKQIIRYISRTAGDPQANHWSVQEIDAYLDAWYQQGYKLYNTHYLGENPEGFGVLYIMTK